MDRSADLDATCEAVQVHLELGEALPDELAAHLKACSECRHASEVSRALHGALGSGHDWTPGERVLDQFELLEELGRGGQGVVFKARDLETALIVALKIVPLEKHSVDEVLHAIRITHPNVCRVNHTRTCGPHRVIVMEYVRGGTLREKLAKGPMSKKQAMVIFRGICEGVRAVHDHDVLHLDLKPGNILLRDGVVPVVSDFGLAAVSGSAPRGGTDRYMAPEQMRGERLDQRTDIFALGVILGELLPNASPRVRAVIERACMASADQRIATVGELLDLVDNPLLDLAHAFGELVGSLGAPAAPSPPTQVSQHVPPPARAPTPATPVIVFLVVVPLVCLALQVLVSGGHALLGPCAVLAAGIGASLVVGTSGLRRNSPAELVKNHFLAVPVVLVFLAGEGLGLRGGIAARLTHKRIVDALASSDPCAVEALSMEDVRDLASEDERRRVNEGSSSCETLRTAKAMAERCARMSAAIDRGEKSFPDIEDLPTAKLAQRLAEGTIASGDLALSKTSLSVCVDALWERMVSTAAKTPSAWGGGAPLTVSDEMKTALSAVDLSPAVQDALRARAEVAAAAVLNKKRTDDMAVAKTQCDQAVALHVALGPSCEALGQKYAIIAAGEAAAAKAKADHCDALRAALNSCLAPCLDIDLFDPRAAACEGRCNARFPTSGCD